ncbi:MAG TPA: MarR family transcriptional regulator [Candidatus Dormibacteraeota bacterium]|jgi:DNA-binding MarR family transcriptional regulator
MNRSEIKDFPFQRMNIRLDKDGCLYMVESRELLKNLGSEAQAGLEAMGALRMAGKVMHLTMERWADRHGLSEGRMSVMFRLRKAPDQRSTMSELAAVLSTTPRNITGLVDNLERDGFVQRVPDPDDRRSIQAQLTPAGIEKIDSIWRASTEAQTQVTKQFTKHELAQLRHLCLKLVQLMKEEAGQ